MNHDEFIGQVAHRARLSSRGDALRATRATLETLANRIPKETATNLGAQLPRELGLFLEREGDATERFDSQEFVERVAERADVDLPTATYQVRAVLDVVQEAATPGGVDAVREALPQDFQQLFEAGVEGKL